MLPSYEDPKVTTTSESDGTSHDVKIVSKTSGKQNKEKGRYIIGAISLAESAICCIILWIWLHRSKELATIGSHWLGK